MSLKVSLTDFQSFAKAEFEIKGFTIITGANDLGKSSLMRAVRYALDNQRGDYFIRNGRRQTQVRLKFDYPAHGLKGRDILWEKARGSSAVYSDFNDLNADGTPTRYEKMEGGIQALEPAVRFGDVVVGDDTAITPQIGMGYDGPFVVTASDDGVYKAFSSLFDLTLFQKLETSIRQEEAFNKRTLTESSRALDQRKAEYQSTNYPALEAAMASCQQALTDLNAVVSGSEELANLAKALQEIRDTRQATKAVQAGMRAAAKCLAPLMQTAQDVLDLREVYESLVEVQAEALAVRGVRNALQDFLAGISADKLEQVQAFTPLKAIQTYQAILTQGRQALTDFITGLQGAEDYLALKTAADELEALAAKRVTTVGQMEDNAKRLSEIETKIQSLDVCPLCRRPMREETHAHT